MQLFFNNSKKHRCTRMLLAQKKQTNKQTNKPNTYPTLLEVLKFFFFFLLLLLLLLFSPRGPAVGATASEFTAECPPNV